MKRDKWELSFGMYPGFLIGIRSYTEPYRTNHVLYLPFVDICLTIKVMRNNLTEKVNLRIEVKKRY